MVRKRRRALCSRPRAVTVRQPSNGRDLRRGEALHSASSRTSRSPGPRHRSVSCTSTASASSAGCACVPDAASSAAVRAARSDGGSIAAGSPSRAARSHRATPASRRPPGAHPDAATPPGTLRPPHPVRRSRIRPASRSRQRCPSYRPRTTRRSVAFARFGLRSYVQPPAGNGSENGLSLRPCPEGSKPFDSRTSILSASFAESPRG